MHLLSAEKMPDEKWVLIDEFEVDLEQEDDIDAEIEMASKPKPSLLSQVI
jgi:hypothetical protein